MIYYVGILIICFFSFFFFRDNKFYTGFFLTALGIFLCFGYMTGTDWRNYEPIYNGVSSGGEDLWDALEYMEPGYIFYNYLFGSLGIDFWHFFIFTKVVVYCIVIWSLQYYCPKELFFLALLFFISWFGYFLFIDNPMRNIIAVGVFLLSSKFLINRRLFPYLACTLLAVSFHFSAIVMLLLYWLANKSFSSKGIILIYIILNVVFLSPELIYTVVDFLFGHISMIAVKIESYRENLTGDGGGKMISFGLLIHNVFFILLMLARNEIEKMKNGKMIFIFSIVFLIFFRLGLTITVMGRFQLYVAVFYAVAVCYVMKTLTERTRIVYALYILLVCIAPCINYLMKDSRYIPYTNYLFFSNHNLSYEDRSDYNPMKSPYKDPKEQ